MRNLKKINIDDLKDLERILWHDLGSQEEYVKTTDIKNLAAFVRSIVGLDQQAVNEKFGKYLNGVALGADQQEFLKTIIDYVRENGDISRDDLLNVSPFDDYDIMDLFGASIGTVGEVVDTLESVIALPVEFYEKYNSLAEAVSTGFGGGLCRGAGGELLHQGRGRDGEG